MEMGSLQATADGSFSLLHPSYGEAYHSRAGARTEVDSLYIAGSDFSAGLAQAIQPVSVLDVGLGLGYTALATISAWQAQANPPALALTSLELNPELVECLAAGTASWMLGWDQNWCAWAMALKQISAVCWQARIAHRSGADAVWQVIVGDAASQSFSIEKPLDYIWQDPFSPQKNPELWTADWFASLRAKSVPGAVLVTYSVARTVRDHLSESGWEWQKMPGHGPKRWWLRAQAPR